MPTDRSCSLLGPIFWIFGTFCHGHRLPWFDMNVYICYYDVISFHFTFSLSFCLISHTRVHILLFFFLHLFLQIFVFHSCQYLCFSQIFCRYIYSSITFFYTLVIILSAYASIFTSVVVMDSFTSTCIQLFSLHFLLLPPFIFFFLCARSLRLWSFRCSFSPFSFRYPVLITILFLLLLVFVRFHTDVV